ncbi:TPA: hypothetical protein RMT47_005036, partial [Escherichia coli]|nr:hypothetical protein [Escherichia coli]
TVPVDMVGGSPGTLAASQVVLQFPITRTTSLPAALAGSAGYAGTPAGAATQFTISKIVGGSTTTNLGTINWAAGARQPTFTFSSAQTLNATDVLIVTAAASADANLANATFTLRGTASAA